MAQLATALTLGALLGLTGCGHMRGQHAEHHAMHHGGQNGVVIQVSDDNPKTWGQALNVVRNIQKHYGPEKVDVELVVFGHGIGMLELNSPMASRISETLRDGTKVLMCQNTMRGRKKTAEDMLPDIGYVKAGVIEIIEKQKQGWTAVRP